MIWALIGALAYRIKGGLISQLIGRELPNFLERSVWCLYLMFSFPLSWASLSIFGLAYAGVIEGYLGGKFDLSLKENRKWKNYVRLSARGVLLLLPLTLCFYQLYPWLWLGLLAGALMPICYLIGLLFPKNKYISHSQYGEFLIGLTLGFALEIAKNLSNA